MKKIVLLILILLPLTKSYGQQKANSKPPAYITGSFEDDYQEHYKISDTLWIQLPNTRFHIIKWDTEKQYIIARNDNHNPGDRGLYTRIDYMTFNNTEPWKWGYCLTAYNAASDTLAEATAAADRDHPTKGCNGYPFSRMKK